MGRKLLALCLALLLAAALLPAASGAAGEDYVLPVFETADLHGFLVDTAAADPSEYGYPMARLAAIVGSARQGDPNRTLLLDGGDLCTGNAVSGLQNGMPMYAALCRMGYDAFELGGHEFDRGLDTAVDADGTLPDFDFGGEHTENAVPVLCANLYSALSGERVPFTKDYLIFHKTARSSTGEEKTVRIAVIGYLHDISGSILPARTSDYTVKDSLAPMEQLARTLRESGQADAVILLAHRDAKTVDGLLQSGTAIDLICGADSHYPQTGTGKTAYIQSPAKGRGYASAELHFSDDGSVRVEAKKTVTFSSAQLTDTPQNSAGLDPEILQLSREAVEKIRDALTTVLGETTVSVTDNPIGGNILSSTAGNWLCDLANRATGAEVSFTNAGGIGTSLLLTDGVHRVTPADVYTIAPYGNRLFVYTMYYTDLLSVLERSVRSSSLNMRMSGIDCYYTGSSVTALVKDGVCIYKDGRWAEGMTVRRLRVSVNEFVATFPGGPFSGFTPDDTSLTDNESFLAVLTKEGEEHGGALLVDTAPHLIKGSYKDPCEGYTDIDRSAWYHPYVDFALSHGIMGSTAADRRTFEPDTACTRAMIAQMLYSLEDKPAVSYEDSFPDVKAGQWFTDAVLWAYRNGVVTGYDNGIFGPNDKVTREQMAVILKAYTEKVRGLDTAKAADLSGFADENKVTWAKSYIEWAVAEKLLSGKADGDRLLLDPQGNATRAEVAAIMRSYLLNIIEAAR